MSDKISSSKVEVKNKPQSYRDLLVWQKGIALAKMIYQVTEKFPSEEKFGLISQMRRAAASIPSNLAEGQARRTTGEFVLSISHAEGSLAELETQMILAVELGFANPDKTKICTNSMEELRRMLNAVRRTLTNRSSPARHPSPVTRHSP